LVGYPLLNLAARGKDLHRYLRFLEEVLILVLSEYAVVGRRRDGMTGVWVEDRKIASIGIGVRRWISMHGFALNVGEQLPGFDAITPCGIEGVRMTSLSAEAGRLIGTEETASTTSAIFIAELGKLPQGMF
jgi:lipoyl(octanoyl) transferase